MDVFERLESNVRSYCRSFPAVFDRAKMSKMYSVDGREYIDFFSGAGALNYGHNNEYIKERLLDYIADDRITHGLDFSTGAKQEFFEAFEEKILAPRNMHYKLMSCSPSGTNAVEAALKVARKVTGRPGGFAMTGGYHGASLGSLSVTSGRGFRDAAGIHLDDVVFIPHPDDFPHGDSISYIEFMLTSDHSGVALPAALIVETLQAEGGVRPMSFDYLRQLSLLCKKNGILLIIDDIQAGCGRTGPFFSFEDAGIEPDLVTLSKSISGYGLPMSLLLIKPEYDVLKSGSHTGTFRGNQLAFVAGSAALELREQLDLESRTKENGKFIKDYIDCHILLIDNRLLHRGRGMMHGIDFEGFGDDKISQSISAECFNRGLIIERCGKNDNVLKIMPALTIERDELTTGLEIIEKTMRNILC